ncbi:MAG: PDZ domain-containing protein [Planctomycetes bacterium]|nr:PDZ domain-containing protein [Planctomycetota bacterium]
MTKLLSRLALSTLLLVSLALASLNTPQAQSAPDIPVASLEDFAKLQAKIQEVAKKNRPAVVGLRMGGSSGSGSFISEDGWIATAGHVSNSRAGVKCKVITYGGDEFEGTVAGYYQSMDQGLVKADTKGKKVPFVQFGDSNKVSVGQWVIAMGHPLGVESKRDAVVRAGRVLVPKNPFSMIVMDAPVISGDSGGPVFDLNGKLIAINQSIQTNAVSINNVTPVATLVEALDRMKKGEQLGMDRTLGRGRERQVLTDAETMTYERAMQEHMAKKFDEAWKLIEPLTKKAGCPAVVLYNAACVASLLSETKQAREKDDLQKIAVDLLSRSVKAGWADVELARGDKDLDPLRKRKDFAAFEVLCETAGIKAAVGIVVKSSQGIKVSDVKSDSPAAKAGFEKGDTITHIGGRKIADGTDWIANVVQNGAEEEFAVTRGAKKLKLKLKVPAFGARVATYGGVQVMEIAENSPAYKAGFKKDDVITMVGKNKVANIIEFANALLCIDGDSETAIAIKRGPEKMVIKFQFEGVEEFTAGWLRRADQKQGDNLLKLWDKLLAPQAAAVFVVKQKGRQAAFATAVDANYLVTKASELDTTEAIVLLDDEGKETFAKVAGRDNKLDLALLKVEAPLKLFVKFEDAAKSATGEVPAVGTFIATLDARGHALAHGFVALPGYNSDAQAGPSLDDAVMGVTPDIDKPAAGVKVIALTKDGPAEKAGVKIGDLIKKIGDKEIRAPDELKAALSGYSPGETIKVVVDRAGKAVELDIKLISRREAYGGKEPQPDAEKPGTGIPYLGITDVTLAKDDGVKINGVIEGSPADLAGIKAGDILLTVDGQRVAGNQGIADILKLKKPGNTVKLKLKQGDKEVDLEVELAEADKPLAPPAAGQPNVRGPINDRCDKFGNVIQHDGVVMPYQQGSPVVDLKGNIVGLNIARSDRTRTFAIPAARVAAAIKKMIASGGKPDEAKPTVTGKPAETGEPPVTGKPREGGVVK